MFACRALFPDRDCYALVRPMNDETKLANLDQVPKDQLRPEFASVGPPPILLCTFPSTGFSYLACLCIHLLFLNNATNGPAVAGVRFSRVLCVCIVCLYSLYLCAWLAK